MIKKLLILIIPLLIILASTASAATCKDHNTWGYAWSDSIGWISFSCVENTPVGSGIDYGVDIDADTGEMSGYAWSENIGWISFDDATVNLSTGAVSGWARALAPIGEPLEKTGGWDGWISLSDTDYQVQINSGLTPSEFENWAWGSDIVGWVSFNCSNTGDCGTSDYKVYTNFNINNPPSVNNLSFAESNEKCFISSPKIFLNWTFSDPPLNIQSAYQVQIDNNSDFSSIEIDTGKVVSASGAYFPPGLEFGKKYYWRIMVWDDKDKSSIGWVKDSFTTDSRWPEPSFTYTTTSLIPVINIGIAFDGEVAYCSPCSYAWVAKDSSGGTAWTSIIEDPTETFVVEDDYNVKFTATSGPRSCYVSRTVLVGGELPPPIWEEITPSAF